MSEESTAGKILDKGKELIDNLIADKLKNNFYGYLIVSFVIVNFENIILILKSKNDIEMTLIYIQAQPNFAMHFFWLPLLYGIGAALGMPIITALYAVFAGVFDAIRTESKGVGSTLWARAKEYSELKLQQTRLSRTTLFNDFEKKKNDQGVLNTSIKELIEQKNNLERYLAESAALYKKFRIDNGGIDLIGLLEAIEEKQLYGHYPDTNALLKLIDLAKEAPLATPPTKQPSGVGTEPLEPPVDQGTVV